MTDISFELREPRDEERVFIASKLLALSEQALRRTVRDEPFAILAYEKGALIGSVIGKIYCNWLHIDLTWVSDMYRHKGLGSSLMTQALEQAKDRKLSGIEVWTQSWQAPEFYRKLGYEEFAVIDDFNPGQKRHAFRYILGAKS